MSHTTEPRPTIKDITRSITRLETTKLTPTDKGTEGGWSLYQMTYSVADLLSNTLSQSMPLGEVTRPIVAAILLSHGARSITVDRYATRIAKLIRAHE